MPASGRAAPACEPHTIARAGKPWPQLLTRTITVRAGQVTLKDALERIANAAHLRLSYSADLLPLERPVCAMFESAAVGDVLNELLRGVAVEPVVASADHVVLAPSTHVASLDEPEPSPVYPLKPLVATATSLDGSSKPTGYAAATVEGSDVAMQGSVGAAINARVPGVWSFQSPAGFTAQFSSRGASSFGVNTPKVYIDGIEVANPLLAAQIAPEDIERIEVIRGPQGAALYGADALNGVTNIVTRHGWSDGGLPRLRMHTGVAFSGSDFTGGASVGQDHALGLQFGTRARSGNLNLGMGSIGEYMPGAYARHFNSDGSFRVVGTRLLLTGTARLYAQSVGNPASTLLDPALHSVTPVSMRQYTTGLKAVFHQNERITHSLVAGIDGYTLGDIAADSAHRLTAADSLLRAWDDGLRTTLRFATVAQLTTSDINSATLTVSAEHSGLHQYGNGDAVAYTAGYEMMGRHPGNALEQHGMNEHGDTLPEQEYTRAVTYDQARNSNGLSAQLDAALHDHLFVNAGLRLEHDALSNSAGGSALLPMLGAAYVISGADLVLKVRGAYGKAVRWPEAPRLDWAYDRTRMVRPVLAPEQQAGVEAGLDVSFRNTIGLQITRYDQTASGLSQLVALQAAPAAQQQQAQQLGWTKYALQSVGEIANRGWELQGFARRGGFSLTGTMALTDSRVQRVANGYTGDLQSGDRMLGVPARTMSLNASWVSPDWSASVTGARAFDWINYDRAGLLLLTQQPVGVALRQYWEQYNGFTHVRATFSHALTRGFTLQLTGDNLLGRQLGEPDNLTVVPGRTFSFGLRAAF